MQQQLDSFRTELRLKSTQEHSCAYIHGGVELPLASLTRIALSNLQESLTITPRNTYDSKIPTTPIQCYRISETHITVPRSFGYQRACTYQESVDRRVDGTDIEVAIFNGTLNSIQNEASEKTLASLSTREQACILTLPCGFGKTVVALHIAHKIGKKTLVVVHKDFLLNQWKARLKQFIPSATVSTIQGNGQVDAKADFVVAMLQTLCIRLEDPTCNISKIVATCGLAIIDEAHHMAARSFSKLFFNLSTRRLLGLTATPQRKDGCTSILHMYMGSHAFIVEGSETSEIPRVQFVEYSSPQSNSNGEISSGMIQKIKTELTQDDKRNRVICDILVELIKADRQIICLSDRLAHLSSLLELFRKQCSVAHKVSLFVGGQKKKDREYAENECNMLFGTYSMAQEGLDVPRLDTLVLATPASDITQAVGRILRPCESKQPPLIVDIQDDRCLQFVRQNQCRRKFYSKRGITAYDSDLTERKRTCDDPENSNKRPRLCR